MLNRVVSDQVAAVPGGNHISDQLGFFPAEDQAVGLAAEAFIKPELPERISAKRHIGAERVEVRFGARIYHLVMRANPELRKTTACGGRMSVAP